MSVDDSSAAGRHEQARTADQEAALTVEEQRAIALRLGPMLAGVGLLGLGALYGALFPGQSSIAAAMKGLAALVVSLPIFKIGVSGFLSRPAKDLTEQLVSLAILAALATGDFVTATLVPLFLELGHFFEERSSRGARAAIDGIRRLSARRAIRLVEDEEREIKPEQIDVGDHPLVRPGEIIPADGRVLSGHSSVDQSPITGESLYEDVGPGHEVYSGTVNLDGLLRIEASSVGGGTVIGRVLDLLREVESSKTPVLRLLERYAGVYLPIVLAVAGVTLFVTGEVDRAIAVLIVSCPCALVLAGPAAMVAAMTASTRLSMLIKSAGFLETVADIETLILDKTGTVTTGALSLGKVHTSGGEAPAEDVVRRAAICGHSSLHPVSRAAVEAADRLGLSYEHVADAREIPGQGVEARAEDGVYRMGRRSWLESLGLDFSGHEDESGPGAWVAEDGRVLGFLSLEDRPREEAQAALTAARRLGIQRVVMLTGDREGVARGVAEELGFDDVIAEVLPEQKLDIVRAEQEGGRKVMMVGDGVNDALALSRADVGVALGQRISEVALGGADVALMRPDLGRIPLMLRLAAFTRSIVILNAVLGMGFSILMMALASTGVIDPLVGAVLHNAGSLFVVLNSSRILRFAEPKASRGPYVGPLPASEPHAAPQYAA